MRGTWWHTLHDGMEQRLGGVNWGGGFDPFLQRRATDTALREFSNGLPGSRSPAFEDRLLCARGREQVVLARPRLVVGAAGADDHGRGPTRAGRLVIGGDLRRRRLAPGQSGGRRRRHDAGAGVRFGETLLDGTRVGLHRVPLREGL